MPTAQRRDVGRSRLADDVIGPRLHDHARSTAINCRQLRNGNKHI
jgi:hypothetical protein